MTFRFLSKAQTILIYIPNDVILLNDTLLELKKKKKIKCSICSYQSLVNI